MEGPRFNLQHFQRDRGILVIASAGKGLRHPSPEDHICRSFPVNRLFTPYAQEERTDDSTMNSLIRWWIPGFAGCTRSCQFLSFFLSFLQFYLCVWVFCMHVCLCTMSWLVSVEVRRGSPRTEVTDGYRLTSKCWELNLGSLEEPPDLSTTEAFL